MKLFVSILLLGFTGFIYGQKLDVKANKTTVGVGERVQVSYTLEGDKGRRFVQPTFNGFRLLSGPNTSSNMQFVNGVYSMSQSISFILLALEEGEYNIDPASIEVNGNNIKSDALKLKVVKGKTSNAQVKSNQQQSNSNSSDLGEDLYMKLYVDKKNPYVGEQVVATYKLYLNAQVVNYAHNRPVFNGFYAQDIEIDPNTEIKNELINGKQFRVATMKRVVLTPQKSGELTIPPLEMEMVVRVEDKSNRRNFNPFFGSYQNVKVEVVSNEENLNVKALPLSDQPSDFTGAVGTFKLKTSTDRTTLNVNEAVNLTVTLEGTGNIELVADPKINFPKDFDTYEPKVKQNVSVTGAGTAGKKMFEYVLIPRYSGTYEIEPISMSYFDPKTGDYKRLHCEPITLSVLKTGGAEDRSEVAYIAPKKEDVQILGKDIRFIKPQTEELMQDSAPFFGSTGFYVSATLPLIALGLSYLLIGSIRRRDSDLTLVKSRKAKSVAKKRLAKAQKLLNGADNEFYEEIFKALYGYLSDKLNIPVSELTKEAIASHLAQKHVSQNLDADLRKALDECEMARFAPGVVRSKPEMMAVSIQLIQQLEDEI